MEVDGRIVHLVKFQKPDGPFMILDQMGKGSEGPRERSIIRLCSEVTLGRATDRDLRVLDISVSRCHCSFSLQDNQVFLTDSRSKFGTLL